MPTAPGRRRIPEQLCQKYSRPIDWHFATTLVRVIDVIRARGAASIHMGRTPHEMHDELCRHPAGLV